jgi:polar amino acid transport system substrate-binding protein
MDNGVPWVRFKTGGGQGVGLDVSERFGNGPGGQKDGKTMEQTGSHLSPDRSLTAEHEGVSRRNLLTLAAPALAAVSMIGPSRAEAAVPPGGSRLSEILKSGKLRVGTFLQYKPYTFKNPAGEADGWDTDVAKAMAEDMGVKPEFVDNSWDGIIPALQADKFDVIIAAMSNTKKRSLVVNFTHPYYMASSAFIYRTADAAKFSTLDKFNNASVKTSILIQDASHITAARFFPKSPVVDFNSAEEAILAVQTRKVDCSMAEFSFLSQYAKEHQGLSVKVVDYPGSTSPLAMALIVGPENEHFKTFLNSWIQHFFWSGQYEPIYKKWFAGAPLPKIEKFIAPL